MSTIANFKGSLDKSEIKLISQIPVSDEEYNVLLSYARDKVNNILLQQFAVADVYLSIALVQIAIRTYTEGNYWNYFEKEIGFEIPAPRKTQLGKAFMATLRKYNLFEITHEIGTNQAYVENIKAHAYVPNSYMNGYLDFLFSFYDRNCQRNLSSDIDEDINEMIDFMDTTLSDKTDKVRLEKFEDKAPKSYKLLKATRQVIAQCSSFVTLKNIKSHLKMIDEYYYDDKYPVANERFAIAFNSWVKDREKEIIKGLPEKRQRNTSKYYRKPHFEIDRNSSVVYLVIPEQKIRNEEFNGQANVIIEHNGHSQTLKLSMYRAYGTLVSEPTKILIPDMFGEYNVIISSMKDRIFNIPSKDIRIFDEKFNETNTLPSGNAYLLVKKGCSVKSDASLVYANLDLPYWDEYSYARINNNSVVYVDEQPYSTFGAFADKIEFNYVSSEFTVSANGYKLNSVYRHPTLSFKVKADTIKASFIWCNSEKINVADNADAVVTLPGNDEYLGVVVNLAKLINNEDGFYNIYLDEPGTTKRLLCNYVLLFWIRCIPERTRYIYSEYAEVVVKGNYEFVPVNCTKISEELYQINLNKSTEMLLNICVKGITYTLHIQLEVFRYGFEKEWKLQKIDMLWHTELKNDLYVYMPYATQAKIGMNRQTEKAVSGKEVGNFEFRFDLTTLVQDLKVSKHLYNYVDLYYFDRKWRSLPIYRVLKQLWISKFKLIMMDSKIFLDVGFEGKTTLKVLVYEHDTDNLVVEKYLEQGLNEMPELTAEGLYRIERYESIQNDFGFEEELKPIMKPLYKQGIIHSSTLGSCKLYLNKFVYDGEILNLDFQYTIFNLEKIDEYTYRGNLHARGRKQITKSVRPTDMGNIISGFIPRNMYEKRTYTPSYYVGKSVTINLVENNNEYFIDTIQVEENGGLGCLYFDKKYKQLISWDHKAVHDFDAAERVQILNDDKLEIQVEFRRVK